MTDIEIANECKMLKIDKIAKKMNIKNNICMYGDYKAKINLDSFNNKGKLIIVSAINPTPYGEGKTTVSISLNDALCKLNKKSVICLREPSMGPVFGVKGGATGGGYAQVVPMEDINLNFTGDIYAITQANNLLSSAIDNHIYFGNSLNIKEVLFNRCIDLNDRALRNVSLNGREESFSITAASEIMSILCLAKDINDLKKKIDNIIIGINNSGEYVFAKELNVTGALAAILKDAIKPNLVQTLENNPAIIHGGPFANISIGCSSLIASNTALSFSSYVIEEAGFGADLGLEKFIDIKCRNGISPSCVVLVSTIRSLKYQGEGDILKGISNLLKHVDTITNVYNLNVIVAINKFESDYLDDINLLKSVLEKNNIMYSIVTGYSDGSKGSIDLAKKIISLDEKEFRYCYSLDDDLKTKILKVCTNVYKAKGVIYSDTALSKLDSIDSLFGKYPICIAKTQYSLSDDPKNLKCDDEYFIHVTDISVKSGAGFILVYTGKILTMPGLPLEPNYSKIDVVDDKIVGIF